MFKANLKDSSVTDGTIGTSLITRMKISPERTFIPQPHEDSINLSSLVFDLIHQRGETGWSIRTILTVSSLYIRPEVFELIKGDVCNTKIPSKSKFLGIVHRKKRNNIPGGHSQPPFFEVMSLGGPTKL